MAARLSPYDLKTLNRLMRKVRVNPTSGCWEWTAHRNSQGYGEISYRGETRRAHRIAYELIKGPIPQEMQLDHFRCDNTSCCNPDHVRPASARENVLRSDSFVSINAAKTVCRRGHELTTANVHIERSGGRRCRICRVMGVTAYRERRKDRVSQGERILPSKFTKTHCAAGHKRTTETTYTDRLGGHHCRACHRDRERARRARIREDVNRGPAGDATTPGPWIDSTGSQP